MSLIEVGQVWRTHAEMHAIIWQAAAPPGLEYIPPETYVLILDTKHYPGGPHPEVAPWLEICVWGKRFALRNWELHSKATLVPDAT